MSFALNVASVDARARNAEHTSWVNVVALRRDASVGDPSNKFPFASRTTCVTLGAVARSSAASVEAGVVAAFGYAARSAAPVVRPGLEETSKRVAQAHEVAQSIRGPVIAKPQDTMAAHKRMMMAKLGL